VYSSNIISPCELCGFRECWSRSLVNLHGCNGAEVYDWVTCALVTDCSDDIWLYSHWYWRLETGDWMMTADWVIVKPDTESDVHNICVLYRHRCHRRLIYVEHLIVGGRHSKPFPYYFATLTIVHACPFCSYTRQRQLGFFYMEIVISTVRCFCRFSLLKLSSSTLSKNVTNFRSSFEVFLSYFSSSSFLVFKICLQCRLTGNKHFAIPCGRWRSVAFKT